MIEEQKNLDYQIFIQVKAFLIDQHIFAVVNNGSFQRSRAAGGYTIPILEPEPQTTQ
jgi:hypothetical protein